MGFSDLTAQILTTKIVAAQITKQIIFTLTYVEDRRHLLTTVTCTATTMDVYTQFSFNTLSDFYFIVYVFSEYEIRCKLDVLLYRTHSSIYQTAYTDACKTHHTITVYTTVFLNMNLQVRNM